MCWLSPRRLSNFPLNLDYQISVKLDPGVPAASGRKAIEALLVRYPNAQVMDQAQYKANYEASIDQLLNLIDGLLVLALVIALMSIANTLALCVYERTRELGLLRAVGMTRRQLRLSIRFEALVTSLLGAIEGLVVGVPPRLCRAAAGVAPFPGSDPVGGPGVNAGGVWLSWRQWPAWSRPRSAAAACRLARHPSGDNHRVREPPTTSTTKASASTACAGGPAE